MGFIKGIASIFDFTPKKQIKLGTFEDDIKNMQSDWEKVLPKKCLPWTSDRQNTVKKQ